MSTARSRSSQLVRAGDINAFFTLLTDNTAAMLLLVTMIGSLSLVALGYFQVWFLLRYVVPGTLVGVLICGLFMRQFAVALSAKLGREATAMPMGLDTPSAITMGLFVLLPALRLAQVHLGPLDFTQPAQFQKAMFFAWNVGMVVTILIGLFKTAGALLGAGLLRSLFPTPALLASLAGIALAVIIFLPMTQDVAAVPAVGLPVLMFMLAVLLGGRVSSTSWFPATLIALVLGFLIFTGVFNAGLTYNPDWPDLELLQGSEYRIIPQPNPGPEKFLPDYLLTADWWAKVWLVALAFLPFALPLAISTLLGGVECVASAEAGGDPYDARSLLLADGLATMLGGMLGSVVPTTLYFGHPAYKTMQARSGYPLAVGVVLFVIGIMGWFLYAFTHVPREVLFPLIVFVGLRTIGHSLAKTPSRYYPAFALAAVPVLAYVSLLSVNLALGGRAPRPDYAKFVQTLRGLSNGFVITSLLWATVVVKLIDRKHFSAALYLMAAAGCAAIGLIHSPAEVGTLGLPVNVVAKLGSISALIQTPTHWAIGYLLAALVVLSVWLWPADAPAQDEEPAKVDYSN